jgi:hypothetical protein
MDGSDVVSIFISSSSPSSGFQAGDVTWFANGQLNACYNAVDRHVPTKVTES